jgi:uncharacterized protein (TIGR02001 family)
LLLAGHALPAAARYAGDPSVSVDAMSDDRRRGLSWSDGDPTLHAALSMPVASGLSLDAAATTARGSARNGGADATIDLGMTYVRQIGGWRLTAEGRYHLFPGASGQGYGEAGATAGFTIGPASLDLAAYYAPRQSAIGGDNLHLSAGAALGLPGTPLTLAGHVGRSTGDTRNPGRAARLRPTGDYWNHGVALDWYGRRWSAGLRYADTDIGAPDSAHAGATLIARVGLTL